MPTANWQHTKMYCQNVLAHHINALLGRAVLECPMPGNGCTAPVGASARVLEWWPGLCWPSLICSDHRHSHQSYETWSKREPLRHLPNYNGNSDPHPFPINAYSVFSAFQCWTALDSTGHKWTVCLFFTRKMVCFSKIFTKCLTILRLNKSSKNCFHWVRAENRCHMNSSLTY